MTQSDEEIADYCLGPVNGSNNYNLAHRNIIEALATKYSKIRELEGKLTEAVGTLEYYEKADYKGEWNDVDGGFHARRSLKVLGGASEEELKKMDDDRRESW